MIQILQTEEQHARCVVLLFINQFMKGNLFSLLLVVLCFSTEACVGKLHAGKSDDLTDSLQVKVYSSGNILKTSPNPTGNGALKISVKSGEDLHFYVFDLTGTLIHRAILNDKEKTKLPPLQKGTYLFDVFKNDLSIEEGKIVIQ